MITSPAMSIVGPTATQVTPREGTRTCRPGPLTRRSACEICALGPILQDASPRYSSARLSRNQRSAAVSAGPAAAGRNGTKGWSETGTSVDSDALRLVLRTQPRSEKSSRIATVSIDTDRLAVCATRSRVHQPTPNTARSDQPIGCWVLDVRCWVLDVRCSMFSRSLLPASPHHTCL